MNPAIGACRVANRSSRANGVFPVVLGRARIQQVRAVRADWDNSKFRSNVRS